MWCRLLKGEGSDEAKPISWQRVSDLPAAPRGRPANLLYSDAGGEEDSLAVQSELTEQGIADTFQKGFRDGEAAGAQKVRARVEAELAQLASAIEQLALHRAKIQRQAEPELVKLSLAIARRILRRELTVDPDSLLGLVKAGLEKIESCEVHRVRVHAGHAATLKRLLEGSARQVVIVADPGLPVGGVVFETSRGSIDTGLETQLNEIERGFTDIYPR